MRRRFAVLGLAALLCALAGCAPEKKAGGPQPFHLYFTCDTSGRIEPCGCFSGQYGGLTRVSTVLDAREADSLKVEIGNAIAGLEDYHVIQYRHLLEACAAMEYAAVNFGGRESRLPAKTIRELAARSPVPLLSANLLDAGTGEPLLATSLIVAYGELKVGFAGVVDPESLGGEPDPSVLLAGMEESLRGVLDDLRTKADVLVCLAFTDEDGLENLAREFYEFDLILGGNVRQPSSTMIRTNQSWILATTNQARALGEVHAEFDPVSRDLIAAAGDVMLMVDSIPEDPAIREHSVNYRKEIRDTELAVDRPAELASDRVPGVNPPATFAGSPACASCHPAAHAGWSKSGHARAFESLLEKDSEADPSCISCHVVGFGEPGGYRRKMAAGPLTGVGCESCHGPGSEHVRVRSSTAPGQEILLKMRPVGQGQCTQCHYGEFSRPFDWNEFWPVIQHGKEGE